MNTKKEKLLNDTYYKWIQTVLYDLPLDGANDFVDPEIMGYGTAIDEKVLSISDYREMVNRQREQAIGLEMSFESTPVFRSISNKEDSAIFVDEIKVSIIFEEGKQELFLRLTTILEYINSKWIVVHLHGSMPTETTAETDTWLVNEWQRKNEQLQKLVDEKTSELLNKNRELEIETALEKVRSSALGMKEPADMVNVCQVISDQLRLLGVKDIRNIQTAIINEQKGTYLNYQFFTGYDKSVVEETEYHKHPRVFEMVQEMKKSADGIFSGSFEGEELNRFREYRNQDNQFADPLLDEATSVHYYFYSIGSGGLGLTTYKPLPDEGLKIFKRFHNVFTLAYRRFIDIELALAQAREARIEAALEKIRSRALAMRNSSEVGNVSTLLFLELEKMDINPSGFSIMIFDEDQDKYELWRAKEVAHQGAYETFSIKAMYDKFDQYVPGFGEELKSEWTKGNPFFIGEFRGEKRVSFLQANREMANYSDEVFEKMIKGWPDPTFWHLVFFKYGWFGVLQNEQLIKEDLLLIHRFAEVFDFAYTRFLDLKNAEAQAREAQIELALERVRARTMGMQKSEELKEVIRVVYEQFVHLKINVDHAGFVVDYKPKGDWHFWIADEQDIPSKITHPYFESVWANQFNEAKEKGADFFATNLNFEEKNKFYNELLSYVPGLPEASKDFYLSCPGLAGSTVLLENVGLYIENFSGVPYTDEDNNTLMRFGKVFQQTYTRFLDLQKAEAQAREAQIEAALERVRSRSLAMHKTDELQEVVRVVAEELKNTGVILDTGGAVICTYFQDSKDVIHWTATEDSAHPSVPYLLPYFKDELFDEAWASKNRGDDYFAKEFSYDVKNAFFNYAFEHSDYRQLPDEYKKIILESKSHGLAWAWSKNSAIMIPSIKGELPSEEEKEILIRFAKVFEQSFIRFLDLQKAEAQAIEARIEAALERVRSRTIGMQRSDELQEAAALMFQQIESLGVNIMGCGFNIWENDRKEATSWMSGMDRIQAPFKTSSSRDIFLRIYEAAQRGESLFVEEQAGKELLEHYKYMASIPVFKKILDNLAEKGLSAPSFQIMHCAFFSQGYLMFITHEPASNSYDIFKRFAKVFEQTYTRFLDLQKAEAQAREAQIETALEKVRSRSLAMHKADELGEVISVIFDKLEELEFSVNDGVALITFSEGSKDLSEWMANPGFGSPINFQLPYFDHPVLSNLWDAKNRGEDFFVQRYSVEESRSFLNHIFNFSDYKHTPQAIKDYCLAAETYATSIAFQKYTAIFINDYSGLSLTSQEIDILKRCSRVFEQAYIRFLDLQKAEAQAREARVEAALERVRSRSMAMHQTSEMQSVIHSVHQELIKLNLSISGGSFIAINADINNEIHCWGLGGTADTSDEVHIPRYDKPFYTNFIKGIKSGPGFFTEEYSQEEKIEFFTFLFQHEPWSKLNSKQKAETLSAPGGYTQSCSVSKHTSIFIINHFGEKFSEAENDILKRIGKVFEQSYTRFLDLQKAEAQARESQIEAALERVRSRTMGMQRSDELAETVSVLFKQLLDLGVKSTQLRTCGIATFKENEPLGEIWITNITGEIISDSFDAPYDEAPAYKTIYSKWKSGEKFLELNLKGDEFLEHLSFVKKYSAVPNINLDEIKKLYTEIFIHVIYFSQGYLFIISYEALTEYHEIFQRFGALFNQTYTRFLDFKKVEAQNEIIQAENERKTKELEDARQLQLAMLPKELPQLSHLDIAVHMKTATEVGGDYYDFNIDINGTLTVVLGDATGHGMMSGMMVSIMKSFFISNKANIELKQFFENANNSIKDMHLGRLMMSFMGVQITSHKLIATNAGMPSLIYFRNKSKKAGEFVSNNLPLGAMKGTKYSLKEIVYEKGDTLLLMSDGFAELKNKNNEQYGYPRIIEEFRSVAHKNSNAIVEHLNNSASEWIKGIEPDDDVTFVVLKVK